MASVRKNLRSAAQAAGGQPYRNEASDLLTAVPDIAATGFVKTKYFPHDDPTRPSFEAPINSGIRLMVRLQELGRKFDPWMKRPLKGNPLREVLHFSTDEDAILARLMIDG